MSLCVVGHAICYANASLSVLLSFTDFLISLQNGHGISAQLWTLRCLASLTKNRPVFAPDVLNLFDWNAVLQRSSNPSSNTVSSGHAPGTISSAWRLGQQQDADEFIGRLLELINVPFPNPESSPSRHMRVDLDISDSCTDSRCQDLQTRTERTYRLNVGFRNDEDDAPLVQMMLREVADTEIERNCACGCQTSKRRYSYRKLPVYLPIVLLRFKYDEEQKRNVKVNTRVDVPEELVLNENGNSSLPVQYKLCAVIVHSGGASGGHYYSYLIEPDWAPTVSTTACKCHRMFRHLIVIA